MDKNYLSRKLRDILTSVRTTEGVDMSAACEQMCEVMIEHEERLKALESKSKGKK